MAICSNCGAELQPGKKICTNCETTVNAQTTKGTEQKVCAYRYGVYPRWQF